MGYGKSLAKLGRLTSGTQLNFEARPDINVLGNKNNGDIASLITWPKKFQRLDKTYQYQAIPENENQLVGYILSNKNKNIVRMNNGIWINMSYGEKKMEMN